jgi:hydroxymethylbilane synthase
MNRLGFRIRSDGKIEGPEVPPGLFASVLNVEEMLPCVGQGAIGIETRADDAETDRLCLSLNHEPTRQCVVAERAFLAGMGGGCQSPVAAFAELVSDQLRMRAVSFASEPMMRGELTGPASDAVVLGAQMSRRLRPSA